MKKLLLVGGTGTISSAITELLAKDASVELDVLNRGHKSLPAHVNQILCDAGDELAMQTALAGKSYDAVCDFIVHTPEQAQQRVRLFRDLTKQYVFISTVAVYDHEASYLLQEDSPQGNRHSAYGRAKQACENVFRQAQADGFPLTVVRPSQTYGYDRIPLSVKGKTCWSVVSRIQRDLPVIVHGDGTSIWHSMHTFDFARNFTALIGNPAAIGASVQLVNPQADTWNGIYEELYRQLGRQPKMVHISSDLLAAAKKYDNETVLLGDKQFSNSYSQTICRSLIPNFSCPISIAQGIAKYLQDMADQPEKQQADPVYDAWCDQVIASYQKYSSQFAASF